MKASINHAVYGTIEYEESFWSGARVLTVNGVKLAKQTKTMFVLNHDGDTRLCTVKGSFLTGVSVHIGQDVITVVPPCKWYEIVCSVLIFVLILIWGNAPALCEIVPIVGGAIGGGVSGLLACLNLLLMKNTKSVGKKLAIWLGLLVGTFAACFLLAMALLMLI